MFDGIGNLGHWLQNTDLIIYAIRGWHYGEKRAQVWRDGRMLFKNHKVDIRLAKYVGRGQANEATAHNNYPKGSF